MEQQPEFLVEGILPAGEVHLLGGSSGSGKTTFTFQVFLTEWQQGKPIFDHVSHPVPYSYVSIDRSRSSVTRTLQRLGLTEQITRLICQEELPEDCLTIGAVVKEVLKVHPDSKLIVIEGFQLLAGDASNKYNTVARTLKSAARLCTKYGLTIIGICHSPKMKIDEGFQHPREMLLGSVSWGAYSDTVITLSLDELTGIITVSILPRNSKSEQHELKFGTNGMLEPFVRKSKLDAVYLKILGLPVGRPITRSEVLSWGKSMEVGTRTCETAIKTAIEKNILEVIGTGIYERAPEVGEKIMPDSDVNFEE